MSEKIETGGPAFPHSRLGSDADGISVRDYFAAKALAALIVDSYSHDEGYRHDVTAERAYWFADAMLKAREVK